MDLRLTDEQLLLQDALARFVQKDYAFEKRRAIQKSADGYSREAWATLAEMGVLGLPFPERYGGIGGGPIETMIVMQAIGTGLMAEPFLASVVLAGGLIEALGDERQRAALSHIAAGDLVAAFAHGEPRSRYAASRVETRAQRDADGWRLSGRKSVVLHGGQAGMLLVSARTRGAADDEDGISVFLVEPNAIGLRDYRTIDGMRAADIELDGVQVGPDALLGAEGGAFPAIERVLDAGAAALCAEAVGVMESLNARTLEYIKTRQQFGQPIGRFQVLQHRAVDMFVHAEQSKSIAMLAAMKANHSDPIERRRAVSAAKAYIGHSGRAIAQAAIQLHGGMGVTDDLPASHYAKRLTMIDFWLGDADHHLERFARTGGSV